MSFPSAELGVTQTIGWPQVLLRDVAHEGDRRSIAVNLQLAAGSAPAVVAGVTEIPGVLGVRWME